MNKSSTSDVVITLYRKTNDYRRWKIWPQNENKLLCALNIDIENKIDIPICVNWRIFVGR